MNGAFQPRVLLFLTSFWDHSGLIDYYSEVTQLSFPYTLNRNYLYWEGISLESNLEFLNIQNFDNPLGTIYADFIHEIAGGNPSAIQDILHNLPSGLQSVRAVLKATTSAACSGLYGKKLIETWSKLPQPSIQAISELLRLREIPINYMTIHIERLRAAGIIHERIFLNQRYISLSSWYIELLLRFNSLELGLNQYNYDTADLDDLMPSITSLHKNAYDLVQQLEFFLRNFLITHLSINRKNKNDLLSGLCYKYTPFYRNGINENHESDAQERANQWMERCQENGLQADLNPAIAYLSLSDLTCILKELPWVSESQEWNRVYSALISVTHIRDAVMHNQIIEFVDLQQLYDSYTEIYLALSVPLLTEMKN